MSSSPGKGGNLDLKIKFLYPVPFSPSGGEKKSITEFKLKMIFKINITALPSFFPLWGCKQMLTLDKEKDNNPSFFPFPLPI